MRISRLPEVDPIIQPGERQFSSRWQVTDTWLRVCMRNSGHEETEQQHNVTRSATKTLIMERKSKKEKLIPELPNLVPELSELSGQTYWRWCNRLPPHRHRESACKLQKGRSLVSWKCVTGMELTKYIKAIKNGQCKGNNKLTGLCDVRVSRPGIVTIVIERKCRWLSIHQPGWRKS